jgi:hypothetical protein
LRRRLVPAAAAVGVLAALALPSGALAAGEGQNLTCNRTAPYIGGTYATVTVPAGGTCTLIDVKVLGDATVLGETALQSGGNLELFDDATTGNGGFIGGNLTLGDGSELYEDFGWVVRGTTVGDAPSSLSLDGTVHNVLLDKAQDANLYATTIDGNFVSNGATDSVGIDNTTKITGNVVLNGSSGGNAGLSNYYITNNPEIDGSVLVTDNQALVDIEDNTIRQNLACYGNTPPPINAGNIIGGRSLGQCATPTAPAGS